MNWLVLAAALVVVASPLRAQSRRDLTPRPVVYTNPHPAPPYPLAEAFAEAHAASCAEPGPKRHGCVGFPSSHPCDRDLNHPPTSYAVADTAGRVRDVGSYARSVSARRLPDSTLVLVRATFDWTGVRDVRVMRAVQKAGRGRPADIDPLRADVVGAAVEFGQAVRVQPLVCRGVPQPGPYSLEFGVENGFLQR